MRGQAQHRVVMYARAGCHLCEAARAVVAAAADEAGTGWTEVDVDPDPELASRYGELVPAVTVDGVLVDHWRIDPLRLRRALA
jgi:glutaredoxin